MEPDLSNDELEARVALAIVDGVGPARFRDLILRFGSAAGALAAPSEELKGLVGHNLAARIVQQDHRASLRELHRSLSAVGGVAVPLGHRDYPCRLASSPNPPPVLFVRGRGVEVDGASVAIVGSRAATRQLYDLARQISSELARDGFTIVSGGAYGIDEAAHRGALDVSGKTVSVMGSGLDRLYPERHLALFEEISRSGAVLSTFRPGLEPRRGFFLSRNRVIAALSQAVLVVEAGSRSGALSTAREATEMGLVLLAVPGSPGTAKLLARGALSVRSASDVKRALALEGPGSGEASPVTGEGSGEGTVDDYLTEDEALVLEAIRPGENETVDSLADRCSLTAGRVMGALVGLSLAGLVSSLPGGLYRRI